MAHLLPFATALLILCTTLSRAQTQKNMSENKNPLLCNPQSGICEMPGAATSGEVNAAIT
ncbi:MAG: hypothetical protein RJA20_1876, partial [Bacteroidota bacterium]